MAKYTVTSKYTLCSAFTSELKTATVTVICHWCGLSSARRSRKARKIVCKKYKLALTARRAHERLGIVETKGSQVMRSFVIRHDVLPEFAKQFPAIELPEGTDALGIETDNFRATRQTGRNRFRKGNHVRWFVVEVWRAGRFVFIGHVQTTESELREAIARGLPNRRCTVEPNGLVQIY